MQSIEGEWLPVRPDQRATSIAFNIPFDIVTLGYASGEVSLVKKVEGEWALDMTFSLIDWGIRSQGTPRLLHPMSLSSFIFLLPVDSTNPSRLHI